MLEFKHHNTTQAILHEMKYRNRPEIGIDLAQMIKFDLSDYFAWKYSKTVNTQVKMFNSTLPTLYTYISYDNTNFNTTVEFPLSW